jgi:3D (Asp-Asp-Asp) domain-containing protein
MQLKMTFYGFPDNDPDHSKQIKYPIKHQEAGGTGTYDDPITVAVVTQSNGGNWSPGTLMYVPSLQKYLIVEDECANCDKDQIDVWMNSDQNCSDDVILACENTLTPAGPVEVEINPPAGQSTVSAPLFDTNTCTCSR